MSLAVKLMGAIVVLVGSFFLTLAAFYYLAGPRCKSPDSSRLKRLPTEVIVVAVSEREVPHNSSKGL
jgi:hypothetical protein